MNMGKCLYIQKAKALISHPEAIGWALGYDKFRADLHGEWIRLMVTAEKDMTLQAHRGAYKTTCLCVAIALLMLRYPEKNIIFLRKTESDVAEVIANVKRILESGIIKDIFRALTNMDLQIVKFNTSEITLSNYTAPRGVSQLIGIGIGGSLTGKHADIIITDDIVNMRDRVSRADRERTKMVYMELQNIKNPGGRIINTGTPWHKEDAFTLMPEPIRYDCHHTGMLTDEQIEALRRSMSPSLFAANYELQHIAAENALFTAPPQFQKNTQLVRDGIAHIDAAYGGEDYTAFTCGKRVGDKLYLYGRLWHCHVDNVIDACVEEAKRLMCGPILCEDNGDKGFLAKELIRRYKARTYHEYENKYIKISTYLRKWWPNIVWLEGTDVEYINQIMDYTEDAEHDDATDSAACVCRYYDRRSGEPYNSAIF